MVQFVSDGQSLIHPEAIAKELVSRKADYLGEPFEIAKAQLALVLSVASQAFEKNRQPSEIVHRLNRDLHELRKRVLPEVWQALVPIAQNHSVAQLLLQDPFSRWSFEKPRGYSGDAHLLDFIYGHGDVEEDVAQASTIGRLIYDCTSNSMSSVAVRERRDLLAQHVDQIASTRNANAEILTIAAGHLREADRSVAFQQKRIGRWVALDQDPLSVGLMARDFVGTCVEAIDGSVYGLLSDKYRLGHFDFIYSAGLYDYLTHQVAVRLTKKCLRMLKPGGVLLFANFADGIEDDGYMETFMNWALMLRTETEMWDIINSSVDRNTVDANVFFGGNRNIVYGVINKNA